MRRCASRPGTSDKLEGQELPPAVRALQPRTGGVSPITVEEHGQRLARAQRLLAEAGLDGESQARAIVEYAEGRAGRL